MIDDKKVIYLAPGLGADKRIFKLLDLSSYDAHYIEWIDPTIGEPIESYARRLSTQIKADKPILLGVSFGGIIAVEIGKLIEAERIILVSSVETRSQLPFYFKVAGYLGLYKLFANGSFKHVNFISYWFFGLETQEEKSLLKAIIFDTDNKFMKWAIEKIVNWQNQTLLKNVTSIHGTRDRIFPYRKANFEIEGGGHFMILNRANEVNKILNKFLS